MLVNYGFFGQKWKRNGGAPMPQIEVRRKKQPYTNIPNALIWDKSLRPQTKWVLIAMLSLPEDWDYSIRGLAAKTGLSKDTIAKMMGELEGAGYLRRRQERDGGRFGGTTYVLTDVAGDFGDEEPPEEEPAPCPNLSDTELSVTENSPQQNNIYTNYDLTNPPIVPPEVDTTRKPKRTKRREPRSAPEWKPGRFEAFWRYYPRGENRQAAIRAWDRLRPSDELIDAMARALARQMQSTAWRDGVGIPYASTWLNNRRWEDEARNPAGPESPQKPLRGEGITYL
jgi:hypothetical protein